MTLTPPSKDKPIILLGGLNGGGKTTLLDGLQLALYGKNAHCSNRGELGYEEFLRRSVHRDANPQEGAEIEIGFRHTTEGTEHSYRVNRSWSENGKGVKDTIKIYRDGNLDELLSDQWTEHVETFIPNGISALFFFDGEKIEQLADVANASRVLSTAIHSLLGIDLVDRLTTDLGVLERRKRFASRSNETQKSIEEIQQDIHRLDELLSSMAIQETSVRSELEGAEKHFTNVKTQFRLAGGELIAQREKILTEKITAETRLREAERELRDLAGDFAPLLLIKDLLADVVIQSEKETSVQESKLLGKLLKKRDEQLIDVIAQVNGTRKIIEAVENFCVKDRQKRLGTTEIVSYLNLDANAQDEVKNLNNVILPETQKSAHQLLSVVRELQEKAVKLEQQIDAVPDPEAVESLREELTKVEEQLRQLRARAENLEVRRAQLQGEKERKQKNLEALLFNNIDEHVQHADDIRIIHHSERIRGTLQKFRLSVVQRHVSKIEQLILDSFRQVIRKQSLVSDIKIHPETFTVELRSGDGKSLPLERLSAGERQLLAISMLWGLARASGRSLPTIIDTPLGRLDASHRTHLVERYFPFASHQVVLLSTDEEIDREFFQKLKSRIGRTYRLNFNDETRSTEIEPGYFWQS